ncbi:protein kinase [Cryptosporidium ryanae]|uniref:protein kinase n=1 Tax=Cryptosporidium ryanae TaxID=515981 RepID=UPI003519DAE3|nr:protein kinase [Cryptosporidium ryanae]
MPSSNNVKSGYPTTFIGQSGIGYKICERLGAGSASIVFRCYAVGRRSEDGIMVPVKEKCYAVKIIDMKSLCLSLDYKEKKGKLLEEVVILQKLRHPNIVSLVDYSDSGDIFFLVMDLIEGGELFYKIVESGSLSEQSARYIMKQIVDSLVYMHKKDIIHRDLKPENILIHKIHPGNYFDVKVADFGVAKFLRHGFTQARTLVGTPQYWAPEVIYASKTGESYGPEVDLWSLGVLFYVMLGGAFPFDERKGNLEYLIREGNYHFRYPRFKMVSDQAKRLIQRLLTVDPKERMTLEELVNDSWMNIKDDNAPISSKFQTEDGSEFIEEYNYDREESVIPDNYSGNLRFRNGKLVQEASDGVYLKGVNNHSFDSICEPSHPDNEHESESREKGSTSIGNDSISSEITVGVSKATGVSKNNLGSNSKTSSIMDLNGLLDLQLSVACKLHGIYIAFRHNSAICRVLKQHIHRWRVLQQQSCLTIGRFKQTCESVLDELPDFLLAVNTNEPKLAIELLSNVKQLVDTTQNDVEVIQNGYNDFLFELSIFVESIRDIKRITELSSRNLFLKNSDFGTLVDGGGVNLKYKGSSGLSGGEVNALTNKTGSGRLTVSGDHKNKEDGILVLDELNSNSKSAFDERGSGAGFGEFGRVKSKVGFDPSIFIGYNSARERVIRRITDLFSNTEITGLLHPKEGCFSDSGHGRKVKELDSLCVNTISANDEGEGPDAAKYDISNTCTSGREGTDEEYRKIPNSGGKDSAYITTSLTSARDLFLDFLFLPASICNVPPSGVESLLQESIDFSVPNINSLELSQEGLKDEQTLEDGGELVLNPPFCGCESGFYDTDHETRPGYELCDYGKKEQMSDLDASCSRKHAFPQPLSPKSSETALASSDTNPSNSGDIESGGGVTSDNNFKSSVSISGQISSPLKRIKRNENKLKISYILVRVLAQLRMIETILGRCVAFWGNMNIMIDKILQLRQNAEKLLGFTGNPVLRSRFDERVESYRLFWKELRDICDSYLKSVHEKQVILEEQVHELLDTASKVDTVFNMNFI